MTIAEQDSDGVVADRLDPGGGDGAITAGGGKHGQRIALQFLAKFPGVRRGAHPSQPAHGIVDSTSIRPFHVQADRSVKVEADGGGIVHEDDANRDRPFGASPEPGLRTLPHMKHDPHGPGARLSKRLGQATAPVCVGLDPVVERMPSELGGLEPLEAIERFSRGVIDAVSGRVPCLKIQSACFERYGHLGVATLERVTAAAVDAGFETILDAKRGDIGISARHYAVAAAATGAGWITLNGYLGEDGIIPFLEEGLGVFVLVRTSNPSGDEVQSPSCEGGTVASLVGRMVARLGGTPAPGDVASVGAVVGATKPESARLLRETMPCTPFLLPGYGAQGGGADGVRAALDDAGGGVLVTASRSIIRAWETDGAAGTWTDSVAAAADRFVEEITAVVGERIA